MKGPPLLSPVVLPSRGRTLSQYPSLRPATPSPQSSSLPGSHFQQTEEHKLIEAEERHLQEGHEK